MSAHRVRNAHGVLGLVIVLLGLVIVFMFAEYKDNIIMSGNYQLFVLLTAIALGLLLYLFFLGGKATHSVKKSSKKSSRKK